MNSGVPEILNDFFSLLYPAYCESCLTSLVKGEALLCTGCLADLPRSGFHRIPENPLALKFRGRLPVEMSAAFLKFRKGGNVQRLLHALKYKNRPEIAFKLGLVYGTELNEDQCLQGYDAIVPVPLHRSRLRQRGYNQSEEWGKGIASVSKMPCLGDVLVRLKKTRTQTTRTKLSRWENVSSVFEVKRKEAIEGKRILLVDDVVTTGATLEACGASLLNAGCRSLGIACLAATS